MANNPKLEGIQWIMTITNTLSNIVDAFDGISKKVPDAYKQKLPGVLGLSLADEQIFGSVLGQLADVKDQLLITDFLSSCEDHERNRFINVVAGMEVIEEGKLDETKESLDADGKKVVEKKSSSKQKKDTRLIFLEGFAKIIKFNSDEFEKLTPEEQKKTTRFEKTHAYCVANRMMIPDPLHKQAEKMVIDFWDKKSKIIPPISKKKRKELKKLEEDRGGLTKQLGKIFTEALFLEDIKKRTKDIDLPKKMGATVDFIKNIKIFRKK